MIGDLIFLALALLTVVPAVWVVFSPNIVHAGFALLFTLLGAAGLYAYLGADFIAVTQVMVYVGGILVLVLFTVMMTRVPLTKRTRHGLDRYVPAAVFSIAVFALLYKVITSVEWGATAMPAEPTIAEIGTKIMTTYIFPFEYISLVLLMVLIGAAILVREARRDEDAHEPAPETPEPPASTEEVAS